MLPRISCYWLRRTFATRLCEAGVSLKVAQYALGHEDVNLTSKIYVSAQEAHTSSEMGKLLKAEEGLAPSSVQLPYSKFGDF